MKRCLFITFCILLITLSPAFAEQPNMTEFQNWAKTAKVPGYSFGGVDETDPGVYMAVWMNPKGEMIGLHLLPASSFKSFSQILNKKKPISFMYKGMPALYSDALVISGSLSVKFEKAGKVISISNQNHPKAFSKDALVKLLDIMKPENLLK